ncbi:MAG TPA: DoxX family protein [Terracidiphilus sp.]|nr:DoxX family protein [Terracidiphilus sp.]
MTSEAMSRGGCADAMQPGTATRASGKGKLWTGRVLSGLAVAFLLFDAAGKLVVASFVVDAMNRLGFPVNQSVGIGVILTVCTLVYAIPRTAVLGAILLTGFLGGAVAIQLRAGSPMFETIFPVLFGILVWSGILLREGRLRCIFPLR